MPEVTVTELAEAKHRFKVAACGRFILCPGNEKDLELL
jgi:hypothetical protein